MSRSTSETGPRPRSNPDRPDRNEWVRTVSLVLIATVLVLGATSQMTGLIIPLILALVLAIALRPLAHRIERLGLGRGTSSIVCTLLVALVLLAAAGLVMVQAGGVIRNSETYLNRINQRASQVLGPLQKNPLFRQLLQSSGSGRGSGGASTPSENSGGDAAGATDQPSGPSSGGSGGQGEQSATSAGRSGAEPGESIASRSFWSQQVRQNIGSIGQWVFRSVGGLLGVLGQAVVFLFLILYMMYTRETWTERLIQASHAMGMKLDRDDMGRMGDSIERWMLCILLVASGYAVTIAIVSLILGLPQWPLWGLMTGFLVLIPYFGALIAGVLLVIVAAATGSGWWAPLTMLVVYVVLQTVESYVILPLLYGRAIDFDPLTVLLGVLFFGFLWGPLGFVAALPVLVLFRGIVEVIPGSEAVTTLLGEDSPDS